MLLILTLIVFIFNLLLGFIAYTSDRKNATNRIFFILTIFMSLWIISNYFSVQDYPRYILFFWIKIIMISTAAIFPILYILSKTFPFEDLGIPRKRLVFIVVWIVFIQILVASSFVFKGVDITNGHITPIPGSALPVFGISTLVFLFLTIYTLYVKLKGFEDKRKLQLKYLIIGISLTFVSATFTNFILVNIFGITSLVSIGPLFTIVLAGFTAYAIVKHELFNTQVVAAQLLTALILAILFSKLFVSQSRESFLIDLFVFLLTVIFGIILVRSISREIQQRKQLEELTQRLRFLDKQKDEFVSMAAHELRAPMTAIKGYLSMVLEGDAGEIPSKARGYLADASSITDRLTRLVNNMLNVSRIEEGRLAYQIEVISLSRVAQMVYNQFKIEAERKGLDIQLDIQNNLNDRVKVDVDKIQEVMSNFASNAVKYTDEGKVVMRLKEGQEGWVRFEVEDTGPGISKDEQKKLFHKFYRAESNVGKTIGTGLGLYICKLLINNFEGRLGLVSNVGDGSLFWFELPLYDGKEGEVLSSGSSDNKDQSNNSN